MKVRSSRLFAALPAAALLACVDEIGGGAGGSGTSSGQTGGGASGPAKPIDLTGDPKYYRFVGLTNDQWARSVQDILRLAPSGLEGSFETSVAGATGFGQEHHSPELRHGERKRTDRGDGGLARKRRRRDAG
jgi:hypothetical protein